VADEPFEPVKLLDALQQHEVEFVVVGVIAAVAQGSPVRTRDLDVTPLSSAANCERLASALRSVRAKLRLTDGTGLEFPIEPRFLAGNESLTLPTRFGVLDLVFMPAGTGGFDDLRRNAIEVELGTSRPMLVAALTDVIRMKEAAGRPKDVAQLPALRQTLEVIREREQRDRRQR
jgi:hypothetical protein